MITSYKKDDKTKSFDQRTKSQISDYKKSGTSSKLNLRGNTAQNLERDGMKLD